MFMSSEHNDLDRAGVTGTEYLGALYNYAMILTRNQAEAEDLVQETYLRAIPAMNRLRPESNVKSWLFRILRNIWLNQLRKLKTDPQMVHIDADGASADEPVDPGKHSYDAYVSKIEVKQVRAAIEQLPAEFREIILLREFEELSYQEIASLLDCPAGTVMSRLARARSKLRAILSPALTEPVPSQGQRAK
jgi:RNA polymerase sigma-70 factor (ECF subfamily)